MKFSISVTLAFLLSQTVLISQERTSQLELSKIMAGNEFIGHQPDNINWSPDNRHFYFSWGVDPNDQPVWFEYSLETKNYKSLNRDEITQIPKDGLWSDTHKQFYYYRNDNAIFRFRDGKPEKVFSFYGSFNIEKVMADGAIVLLIANQIVMFDPSQGTFIQLVKKVDPARNETEDFLEVQQTELFQVVQKRQEKAKQIDFSELPELKSDKSISWFEINENKTRLLFQESDYPNSSVTHYASYLTADGFTKLKEARPKVGSPDPTHNLGMINLDSNIQYIIDISGLTGINDAPDYFKYYPDKTRPSTKKVIYHNHGCSEDGRLFLVEIKSYDNKDRWICTVDQQGKLVERDHQRDTAWIGGPGISGWKSVKGNAGWIDNSTFYFQSEETGYSHLYSYNINTRKKSQLTEGRYEVHEAVLSGSRDKFYIVANHNHPGNRELYALDIKTLKLTGILTLAGHHEVSISPDESQLAIRYSYINKPWEIYTSPLEANATMVQVTESRSEAFMNYSWREPAVVNFEASDGKNLHARLYFPHEGKNNGAGVIFVHGAGYLQNAHNWWSSYYREYMFHNLLADLGYIVLDIDYRASEGYGRDHRVAIYRQMGGTDLNDQLDGRKFLINSYKLDSNRIGIYGGSYGGFITLMALLKHPGKFKCGAALRSVTDWAHYNHPYTSNILNTPETDPIAFRRSSPIYFAENLQDRLIMLHGMEDDNVQYQDVVRLSQRFIELSKSNWDLIGYPVEPHGFKETSSWIDEYRRILDMFEQELNP